MFQEISKICLIGEKRIIAFVNAPFPRAKMVMSPCLATSSEAKAPAPA